MKIQSKFMGSWEIHQKCMTCRMTHLKILALAISQVMILLLVFDQYLSQKIGSVDFGRKGRGHYYSSGDAPSMLALCSLSTQD